MSWECDKDITRDLDKLCGITTSEEEVKSYTSLGRGRMTPVALNEEFRETPATVEDFTWYSKKRGMERFPDSISRGRKIEILKENSLRGKYSEVQEQLRAALGPGHSNAYIEESFKQRFQYGYKNDHENLVQPQFENSEAISNPQSGCSALMIGDRSKSSTSSFNKGETDLHSTSLGFVDLRTKKVETKQQLYPNAVLDSLERNSLLVQKEDVPSAPKFGSKSSNIPPACYKPTNNPFKMRKDGHGFQYKQSDFPPL